MSYEPEKIERTLLKKQAKQILDGKTLPFILCFLIYGVIVLACFALCFFVPNPLEKLAIDFLAEKENSLLLYICFWAFKYLRLILFFALISPFSVCMATVPLHIVKGENITLANTFAPISRARYFIEYMISGFTRFIFINLHFILVFFPALAASYRYSFTNFIFTGNPELTSGEAISKSKELTFGYKGQLFQLDLSFIGWFMFGICTCGIGMFYFVCYYSVTKVLYYQKICGIQSQKQQETKE